MHFALNCICTWSVAHSQKFHKYANLEHKYKPTQTKKGAQSKRTKQEWEKPQ